ncbi:cation diffusion facilitator family transporter [Limimaricola pyoseonensis]|uniref:Ferrous-iron efflux pump FieF n=1 Tax=Limimaricola pyoseonensis TaxID=521013 RepID=A0A1G7C8J1_9RHOB|nr:cation diffusion facilitator family transporter [Limimaricola pyoseonensis]SDE35651.1 ferrous-iron efflux pump FieF [Limimaricola pyoseonensis]
MAGRASDDRLNLSAGIASVSVALVLIAAKLWALWQTGALSVAATLADSALDLVMSLGALAAIAYARRPADADHAFGHSSAEDLAALGQSLFILVSAALIAGGAMMRLNAPGDALSNEGAGIAAMALSIVLTAGLVAWQRRVARLTGNRVVAADSLHYLGDLIPALGAIGALWASRRFGLDWIDPAVALGAAALMVGGALKIGRGAWDALMDRAVDDDMVAGIEAIAGDFPGVHGHHDLRTRRAGSRVFVNLHIELDGEQSLHEAHEIGAALKRAILARYPRADVIIHKDPVGDPHDPRRAGAEQRPR